MTRGSLHSVQMSQLKFPSQWWVSLISQPMIKQASNILRRNFSKGRMATLLYGRQGLSGLDTLISLMSQFLLGYFY